MLAGAVPDPGASIPGRPEGRRGRFGITHILLAARVRLSTFSSSTPCGSANAAQPLRQAPSYSHRQGDAPRPRRAVRYSKAAAESCENRRRASIAPLLLTCVNLPLAGSLQAGKALDETASGGIMFDLGAESGHLVEIRVGPGDGQRDRDRGINRLDFDRKSGMSMGGGVR